MTRPQTNKKLAGGYQTKRKDITAILLVGAMTVSMLVGCGSQPDAAQGDVAGDAPAGAGQEENVAQEEREEGEIPVPL